jgi:hypothetical protein
LGCTAVKRNDNPTWLINVTLCHKQVQLICAYSYVEVFLFTRNYVEKSLYKRNVRIKHKLFTLPVTTSFVSDISQVCQYLLIYRNTNLGLHINQ